jgi:hypothetical protein
MLTDDAESYGKGALTLLRSIKRRTTLVRKTDFMIIELESKPIHDQHLRSKLTEAGWTFLQVPRITPRDEEGTSPRFKDQFSKLNLWNLTQYTDRILYLDSDCLATGSLDELLAMNISSKPIWAARDLRNGFWEPTFNMGVFLIRPSPSEFRRLLALKDDAGVQFETAMSEQGFLNEVYKGAASDSAKTPTWPPGPTPTTAPSGTATPRPGLASTSSISPWPSPGGAAARSTPRCAACGTRRAAARKPGTRARKAATRKPGTRKTPPA